VPVGGPTARLAQALFPNAAVSRTRQRGASNARSRPPATSKFAEFRGVIGAVVVVVDVRIRRRDTTGCRQTSPEMSRIKDASRRTIASGLAMKDPAESNADNQLNGGLFAGRGVNVCQLTRLHRRSPPPCATTVRAHVSQVRSSLVFR